MMSPCGPGSTRPRPVAGSQHGRFRVLHHHADGGIGRVSVALDCELHRQVAVKELQERFADDPQVRQRFMLEVQVTGRLEHPGVVPVYSLGRDGHGRPFYAMRFIEGEDLDRAIKSFHAGRLHSRPRPRQASPRPAPASAAVYRRVQCRRLCPQPGRAPSRPEAGEHFARSLRRDARRRLGNGQADGRNTFAGGSQRAGAGRPAEDTWDKTQQGTILGTIPYMSPEQAGGEAPGKASDVYSLGATLYHLLTGRPPIEKDEAIAMLHRARDRRNHAAATGQSRGAGCARGRLSEGDERRSERPVPIAASAGRRDRALAGRRARDGLEGTMACSIAAVGQPASHPGRRGCCRTGCRGALAGTLAQRLSCSIG